MMTSSHVYSFGRHGVEKKSKRVYMGALSRMMTSSSYDEILEIYYHLCIISTNESNTDEVKESKDFITELLGERHEVDDLVEETVNKEKKFLSEENMRDN